MGCKRAKTWEFILSNREPCFFELHFFRTTFWLPASPTLILGLSIPVKKLFFGWTVFSLTEIFFSNLVDYLFPIFFKNNFSAPLLMLIEFLHRVIDTFTEYFGECSYNTINDNLVIVFEVIFFWGKMQYIKTTYLLFGISPVLEQQFNI